MGSSANDTMTMEEHLGVSKEKDSKSQDGASNLCRLCLFKTNRFNSVIMHTSGYKILPNGKRLMTRMDRFQRKILSAEFERNVNWS